MLQAEAPVLALAQAPLGSTVGRALPASRPVAARIVRAHAAILAGLDPDSVEQGRTDLHDHRLCGPEGARRKLDKRFSLVPESLFRNWMGAAPAAFSRSGRSRSKAVPGSTDEIGDEPGG